MVALLPRLDQSILLLVTHTRRLVVDPRAQLPITARHHIGSVHRIHVGHGGQELIILLPVVTVEHVIRPKQGHEGEQQRNAGPNDDPAQDGSEPARCPLHRHHRLVGLGAQSLHALLADGQRGF
jgi:hypothetical protein